MSNCVFLVLFTWFWEMSSSQRGYDSSIRQIRYSDSKMAEIRCRMTHRQTPTRSWHIHTDQWSLLGILSLLSNLEPALLNPAEEGSIFLLVLTVNIHTAHCPGKYQPESALLHFSLFSSSLLTFSFLQWNFDDLLTCCFFEVPKPSNLYNFYSLFGHLWICLGFWPKLGIFMAQQ